MALSLSLSLSLSHASAVLLIAAEGIRRGMMRSVTRFLPLLFHQRAVVVSISCWLLRGGCAGSSFWL